MIICDVFGSANCHKQVFITIDESRRSDLNNPKEIQGKLIFKYKLQRTRKQKLFGAALSLPKLIKVKENNLSALRC